MEKAILNAHKTHPAQEIAGRRARASENTIHLISAKTLGKPFLRLSGGEESETSQLHLSLRFGRKEEEEEGVEHFF